MSDVAKLIGIRIFGTLMLIPFATYGMISFSEFPDAPVLGGIDLLACVLAGMAGLGAWTMSSWTAYAFAGWVVVSSGRNFAFDVLSRENWMAGAMGSLMAMFLFLLLAVVVHKKIRQYRIGHWEGQNETTFY